MEKVCCVDMDGTICEFAYPDFGEPQPGVKEALQKIKDMGYEIEILSCRTNHELKKYPIDRQEQVRMMEEYLNKHEIPYDRVLNKDKPLAIWYIDDRAIGFRDNWEDVVKEIEENG
jgi:predicted phosphatase